MSEHNQALDNGRLGKKVGVASQNKAPNVEQEENEDASPAGPSL